MILVAKTIGDVDGEQRSNIAHLGGERRSSIEDLGG
jgi:hypothetical protein